jgi:hypothetical protein
MERSREETYYYLIEYPRLESEMTSRRGFQAIVTKKFFDNIIIGVTINYGGTFEKCIEMNVLYNNGKPIGVKINNILSEPECGILDLMAHDKTEYMIKSAIQFVKAFDEFKDINNFELDDMSHIYCDIEKINYEKTSPPRKGKFKLGLPFFYIAYHQKSWYEDKFGAKLLDYSINQNPSHEGPVDIKYKEYRKQMENFENPMDISFFDFASKYGLSIEQYDELSSYYDPSINYKEFFQRIKKNRCYVLYNCIESCVQNIIKNTFQSNTWIIYYDTMEKVPIRKFHHISKEMYDSYIPELKDLVKGRLKNYVHKTYKGGAKMKNSRKQRRTQKNRLVYRFTYSPEEHL